jgi:hypothetical protein
MNQTYVIHMSGPGFSQDLASDKRSRWSSPRNCGIP